jgi:hypothetical protein
VPRGGHHGRAGSAGGDTQFKSITARKTIVRRPYDAARSSEVVSLNRLPQEQSSNRQLGSRHGTEACREDAIEEGSNLFHLSRIEQGYSCPRCSYLLVVLSASIATSPRLPVRPRLIVLRESGVSRQVHSPRCSQRIIRRTMSGGPFSLRWPKTSGNKPKPRRSRIDSSRITPKTVPRWN